MIKPKFTSDNNDVCIHFRCGDIIENGGIFYGLPTIKFYQTAVHWIYNSDHNDSSAINNTSSTLNQFYHENVTIWFVVQLKTHDFEQHTKKPFDKCRYV